MIAWTLTALACGLTTGRFIIHWRKSRKIRCDDILNAAAAILLVGYIITYQLFTPLAYGEELYELGITDKMPPNFNHDTNTKYNRTNVLLFWLVIYTVKASFLALYWELFQVSRRFRIAWSVIAVYTALSFLVTWLWFFWRCGSPKNLVNLGKFSVSQHLQPRQFKTDLHEEACQNLSRSRIVLMLSMWCALNVLGDILRMLRS